MKKALLLTCCMLLTAGAGLSRAQDTTGDARVDVAITEGVMAYQNLVLPGGNALSSTIAPGANALTFAADLSISPVDNDQGSAAVGKADENGIITGPAAAAQAASFEAGVNPADTNPLITGSMAHSHSYLLENQFQGSAAAGRGSDAGFSGAAGNGHLDGSGIGITTMGQLDFEAGRFQMRSDAATTGFASRLNGSVEADSPDGGQMTEGSVYQSALAIETAAWENALDTAWDDTRYYSGDTINSGVHIGWFKSETAIEGYATAHNADGTASFDTAAGDVAVTSHTNTIRTDSSWDPQQYFPWMDKSTSASLNLSSTISGAPDGQALLTNTAGDPVFALDPEGMPLVDPNGNPIVESGGYANLSTRVSSENVGGYAQTHHTSHPMHHYGWAKINLAASAFHETAPSPSTAGMENAPLQDTAGNAEVDVSIDEGRHWIDISTGRLAQTVESGLIDSSCQGDLTTQPGGEGRVDVGNLDENAEITGPAAAHTQTRSEASTWFQDVGRAGSASFEASSFNAVDNSYQAGIYAKNGATAAFAGGALNGGNNGQPPAFTSNMSVAAHTTGEVFESNVHAVSFAPRVGHFAGEAPLAATVGTQISGPDQTAGGKMFQQASVFHNGYYSGRYDAGGGSPTWAVHQQYVESSSKTTGYAAIADASGAASFMLAPQNLNDIGEFAPGNIVHTNSIKTENLWSDAHHSATGSITLSSRINGIPASVSNTAGAPVFALDENGNHTYDENQCVNIESGGFASIHNITTAKNYGGYEQWVEINGNGATGYMYQNASTRIDLSRTIYQEAN